MQPTTRTFTGTPFPPEIQPLHGKFGDNGEYNIRVNLANVIKTKAEITLWNMQKSIPIHESTCEVTWVFPVLNKDYIKKLLRQNLFHKFQIQIKQTTTPDAISHEVSINSDDFKLFYEINQLVAKFNANNKADDKKWLEKARTWTYQPGTCNERIHFLQYLIKTGVQNSAFTNAYHNAISLLAMPSLVISPEKAIDYKEEFDVVEKAVLDLSNQLMFETDVSPEEKEKLDKAIEAYQDIAQFVFVDDNNLGFFRQVLICQQRINEKQRVNLRQN